MLNVVGMDIVRNRVCYICGSPLKGKKRHGFLTPDGKNVYCGDAKMIGRNGDVLKITRHEKIKRDQRKR